MCLCFIEYVIVNCVSHMCASLWQNIAETPRTEPEMQLALHLLWCPCFIECVIVNCVLDRGFVTYLAFEKSAMVVDATSAFLAAQSTETSAFLLAAFGVATTE